LEQKNKIMKVNTTTPEFREAFRFFQEHCGSSYHTDPTKNRTGKATTAMTLARAETSAEEYKLAFYCEDEDEPWDGECPPPKYLWCCFVVEGADWEHTYYPPIGRARRTRSWAPSEPPFRCQYNLQVRGSLGMVGVDSSRDPYLRVVAAELFAEAIEQINAEREREACAGAAEMAERATYAAGDVA
jgi:hypothetical protein